MSRPPTFAWRCTPEFSAVILARQNEINEHRARVWTTWSCKHPGVYPGFRRVGVDTVIVGFTLDEPRNKVPGLSNSLTRGYALPSAGRVGDRWRAELDRLNDFPRLAEVFTRFQVPTFPYPLGLEIAPEGTAYLLATMDVFEGMPPDSVCRTLVEEALAVRERREAREAARKAVR